MKEFREFLEVGIVKRLSPNVLRAKDLIQESERKYKSLKQIINKIGLSNENSNDIIEYCYDIIIGLIRAKMYFDGYKSSGKGAHEAEVSYLMEMGFSETESRFMNEMRYFRNGIKYYGRHFGEDYSKRVVRYMEEMVVKLRKLVKF